MPTFRTSAVKRSESRLTIFLHEPPLQSPLWISLRLASVAITGAGCPSAPWNDVGSLVSALRNRESGIRPLTHVPHGVLGVDDAEAIHFTGDIENYGPLDKALQRTIRKFSKLMCREIEMGVAVAQSLRLPHPACPPRTGIAIGRRGEYGCDYIMSLPEEFAEGIRRCIDAEGQFHFEKWAELGIPQVNPLWLLKYLPNMPASHIAIFNDSRSQQFDYGP